MSLFSSLKPLAQPVWAFTKKHMPEVAIFTGAALDGMAVIFAVRETTIANQVLNEKKPETLLEKVGVIVPAYWKTILSFTTGTGLILFGNKLHLERLAVMAGIAASQKEKLIAMAEEAKKLVGPKKAQEIEDNVVLAKVDREKLPDPKNLPVILSGDDMYMLEGNGFVFRSCPERVSSIEKNMLRVLMEEKSITKADLYDAFDVPGIMIKESDHSMGWSDKHPFRFKTIWTDGKDGHALCVIKFDPEPDPDWILNYPF